MIKLLLVFFVECKSDDKTKCNVCDSGYTPSTDGSKCEEIKCDETCTGCDETGCGGQTDTCKWDSSTNSCKLNCGEAFYQANGKCELCKQSCKTCKNKDKCSTCDEQAGLYLNSDGECISCFKKFPGCKECSEGMSRCDTCLDFFKTGEDGDCDSTKIAPVPKYYHVGFGNYHRDSTNGKVYFRIYLRITSGIMYNCRLKITLKVIRQRRLLDETEEVESYCDQTGTAVGSFGEKPNLSDSTAMLDCKADIENNFNGLQLQSATIENVNGNEKVNKNVEEVNGSFNFNIINKEGSVDENELKSIKYFYAFDETKKTCNCKNGKAKLKIKGSVEGYEKEEINKTNYIIPTSENDASCVLSKSASSNLANLNCEVEISNRTEFKFKQKDTTSANTLINLGSTEGASCSTENDDTKSPSSSGISGGAIAGIVIASIVVAVVVAGIIAIAAKSAGVVGAAGVAAGAEASTSNAGLSNVGSNCISADKMGFSV